MTLSEYFKACEYHDWYYSMSDDIRAWRRGVEVEKSLLEQSKTDSDKLMIYCAWHAYHFTGEHYSKPQAPKPEFIDGRLVLRSDADRLAALVLTVATGSPTLPPPVRRSTRARFVEDTPQVSHMVEAD